MNNSTFAGQIGSFLILCLKVLIGVVMLPIMGAWLGLKFFRRHVYNQGSWWRDISGAVAGIASGVTFALWVGASSSPNAGWWYAAGFAVAFCVYAYVYPALFWAVIKPILPYLLSALQHFGTFLVELVKGLWNGFVWIVENLLWNPLCWLWNSIVFPLLKFVWVQIICRLGRCIRWCWNTFWHIVSVCWNGFWDAVAWTWKHIAIPILKFIWKQIICRIGRFIRSCWRGLVWLWNNAIWPFLKWVWNHILVPIGRFLRWAWNKLCDGVVWLWTKVIVPGWHGFWRLAGKLARRLLDGICWVWKHILHPILSFVWNWILCPIGRAIRACWNFFWRAVRWLIVDVIWGLIKFVWKQIICRILRGIRWLLMTFVIKPLRWIWNHIVYPLLHALYRAARAVYNWVAKRFVSTYRADSTTALLLAHTASLLIPVGAVALYWLLLRHAAEWVLLVALVPAAVSVPLAYVWGGKLLQMVQNWIVGFLVSFGAAYVTGLYLTTMLSTTWSIALASVFGVLLFFAIYPLVFAGWERLTKGSRLESSLLSGFQAMFGRVDAMVAVFSRLCVSVWVFIRDVIPVFLYKTWMDTWNWIRRVWNRWTGSREEPKSRPQTGTEENGPFTP